MLPRNAKEALEPPNHVHGNWRLRMPRSWKPADAIGCPPRTCTSGEEQLAALFESLAGIEDKHANEIDAHALAPSAVACPELLQTTCEAAFVHLLATIATTAIAARLRDAKSESIRNTRAATCRVLGDLHAASKLRRKDSVPSMCHNVMRCKSNC